MRRKIFGTKARPRLTVYRSLKHISVQIVDDEEGKTLVFASSFEKENKGKGNNLGRAQKIGRLIAQRAQERGIRKVVFDRGNFAYHGRIKALAESAREGGLEF